MCCQTLGMLAYLGSPRKACYYQGFIKLQDSYLTGLLVSFFLLLTLLRQPDYFKAPYMLKVNFSWCIELPKWAGTLPTNSPNCMLVWSRENPILKLLNYVNIPSTNPFTLVNTCPKNIKNGLKNWQAVDKQPTYCTVKMSTGLLVSRLLEVSLGFHLYL